MKKYASILLTLVGILGSGAAVQANIRNDIVATFPFEFVADGKTLPAGTYTLLRFSSDPHDGVILTNRENGASVIVHPVETEHVAVEKPSVSFERVGEQRFLTRIASNETVYEFHVSREAILLAAKPHEGGPVAGNTGSN